MARGGAREGAGRPVGSLAPQNKKKILFEKYLISRIVAEKKGIIDALLKSAKSGEVKAISEALNRLLGKATEYVDLRSGGERIDGTLLKVDLSKLNYEELRRLIAQANPAQRGVPDKRTAKGDRA